MCIYCPIDWRIETEMGGICCEFSEYGDWCIAQTTIEKSKAALKIAILAMEALYELYDE